MTERGFTLLELLVVMALAALLLAVTPPLISAALPGTQLRATARELASALRLARNLALTQQRETSLHLDLEKRTYRIGDRQTRGTIPGGLRLHLVTTESELDGQRRAGIRFFPDGGSTGGRIRLDNGRQALQVDVDWFTGRVRLLTDGEGRG